ncbi:NAD(P)H-dependent glycerol-3-phosphate dehydrogenase [soil metagenome]
MGGVAVLQAGAWGTTLATVLARDGGRPVTLWTRDSAQAREATSTRENRRYLPGVKIPAAVEITADLERALAADDLIVALPTSGIRAFRDRIAPLLRPGHHLLSATKGLDPQDGRRMSELWAEVIDPARIAVLSGPNISREIAAGLPAQSVIASYDLSTARRFQSIVRTPLLRAYTNDDVIGVELCGALKNVVALGAGAIDGIGYGGNAKAGFVTRGIAEIARFAFANGANPLTITGLAGFGDLIATCWSKDSRNRLVGELIATGLGLAEIRERLGGRVAEGIPTTEAVHLAAERLGVEMPITAETHAVLARGKPVRAAIRDLMEREPREELSGPLSEAGRLLRARGDASRG